VIREYLTHARGFSRNARLFLYGTFFYGFGFGTFWVLLNLYLREVGRTDTEIGRVLSFQSVGTLISAGALLWLRPRTGLRKFLRGAAVLSSLAFAGMALSESMSALLPCAVLAGMGFATHHVLSAPFFMRHSRSSERLYLFGLAWFTEMTASIIGVLGGGWLARHLGDAMGSPLLGLRFTLLAATLLTTCALIPYAAMREAGHDADTGEGAEPEWPSAGRRILLKLAAPAFIVGFGAGLIIPFLNLYFRDRFDLAADKIGAIFAASQVLTAVGYLVGPVVARRIGMIRVVAGAELASIPFFLLLAFTRRLPVAMAAFWLRGALMNMNHPVATNFAMEVAGKQRQAMTNAVLMLTWNGAWTLSTQIGGVIIQHTGFARPMLIAVALYFTSSCLYLYLFHGYERRVLAARRAEAAGES